MRSAARHADPQDIGNLVVEQEVLDGCGQFAEPPIKVLARDVKFSVQSRQQDYKPT